MATANRIGTGEINKLQQIYQRRSIFTRGMYDTTFPITIPSFEMHTRLGEVARCYIYVEPN